MIKLYKPTVTILIMIALAFNNSCTEEKPPSNLVETTTTVAEDRGMNLANLLGTWVNNSDTKKQFSLYNDGSVDQKNMKRLELKDWTLEENQLVFARKSSSGEQTAMNADRYDIIDLSETQLIIAQDSDTVIYRKK